jgi:hypothetical protein
MTYPASRNRAVRFSLFLSGEKRNYHPSSITGYGNP